MSSFAGYMSFVLLRFIFSFVCECLSIISRARLVLCVFRCVLNFFLLTYQCKFADTVFCYIFAGAKFWWLYEFCVAAVRFFVCLCMLKHYFARVTCALCVSLRA